MSITREQVADLHEGDVVELTAWRWDGGKVTGPLRDSDGNLACGPILVRFDDGEPALGADTLTVVSRAPRPLYVNHPRTEPVPKDVVLDGEGVVRYVAHTTTGLAFWSHDYEPGWGWRHHSNPPKPLRLLVDGETGLPVDIDRPTGSVSGCPSAEHHRRMVRSARAEGWAEGFEAAAEWAAHNPGPGGIPHDPPSNPYETGQVVP